MDALEEFRNKLSKQKPHTPNMVTPNFGGLMKDEFKSKIANIPKMSEPYLTKLIKNNIDNITSDIVYNSIDYSWLFKEPKFVQCFIQAISCIPITTKISIACNKIIYDYFTLNNADIYIKEKYLLMGRIVNNSCITSLMSLGLSDAIAIDLSVARSSSINEETNAKRLNFSICKRDRSIMSEQMIVWIYEKLFDRVDHLFQAIMFDTCLNVDQSEYENFSEVYGNIGLAILVILNNMTSENIQKVLMKYQGRWEYLGRPRVRFSLRSLSRDYSRIISAVEYLSSNGMIIP